MDDGYGSVGMCQSVKAGKGKIGKRAGSAGTSMLRRVRGYQLWKPSHHTPHGHTGAAIHSFLQKDRVKQTDRQTDTQGSSGVGPPWRNQGDLPSPAGTNHPCRQ